MSAISNEGRFAWELSRDLVREDVRGCESETFGRYRGEAGTLALCPSLEETVRAGNDTSPFCLDSRGYTAAPDAMGKCLSLHSCGGFIDRMGRLLGWPEPRPDEDKDVGLVKRGLQKRRTALRLQPFAGQPTMRRRKASTGARQGSPDPRPRTLPPRSAAAPPSHGAFRSDACR